MKTESGESADFMKRLCLRKKFEKSTTGLDEQNTTLIQVKKVHALTEG